MAGEILIFDAVASNIDGTNPGTALEVGPQDDLRLREFDAPAPAQTIQYAGSVDTEGGVPSSRKHENRIITLTIMCMTAASLRTLQAKVGKIAAEGGTLEWILPNAETIVFDLLAADTFTPMIDKLLYVRAGAYCEAQVILPARPYGRGPELDLGDNTTTTLPWLVFTEATVAGDMPALGRLVVDNDEASAGMRYAVWGIQQRYYSSASDAALYYEAESCALVEATAAAGPAGASGAGSNVAKHTNLDIPGNELFHLGASSTVQTHVGSFRVFARVYVPNTNAGTVSVFITWEPHTGDLAIQNTSVPVAFDDGTPIEDNWMVVDLGLINIPKARKGSQNWIGSLWATSTSPGDDINVDWIGLVPVDESYGQVDGAARLTSIPGSIEVRYDGVIQQDATGTYWTAPYVFEGDYLTIPPSGLEARTLRVICRLSPHVPLSATRSTTVIYGPDVVGDISARLYVTPRYLVVPSP